MAKHEYKTYEHRRYVSYFQDSGGYVTPECEDLFRNNDDIVLLSVGDRYDGGELIRAIKFLLPTLGLTFMHSKSTGYSQIPARFLLIPTKDLVFFKLGISNECRDAMETTILKLRKQ